MRCHWTLSCLAAEYSTCQCINNFTMNVFFFCDIDFELAISLSQNIGDEDVQLLSNALKNNKVMFIET